MSSNHWFPYRKNHKQYHQTEDYMRDYKDISHLVALQGICVITYGNLENGRSWRTWENTVNQSKEYMA